MASCRELPKLLLGIFCLGVGGCAQVLGIEDTRLEVSASEPEPAVDDDEPSTDAGPPPEPGYDFSCQGRDWLPESEDDAIEIVARIVEITSPPNSPVFVEGMTVRVCRSRLDITCSGGVEVLSDADGLARVEVTKGFNGYLRIEGPDASGAERVGYLWYFSQPLRNTYVFPILSMTPEFRDTVIYGTEIGSNITRDETRGEIAINVTDCSQPAPPTQEIEGQEFLAAPGVNAPEVHLEITDDDLADEMTRQFYFSDNQVVWPRREADQLTDATGLGGFLNVRAGTIPIAAVPTTLGEASAEDTLLVRANFLTTVRLLPD